jgi:thiosulfate/3-mercaptopyruvate sulfurtransferase
LAPSASISAQAPRETMVVSTAWLAGHLTDSNLVLLHLEPKPEYDAAHIPGARFITLNDIAISDTASETGLTLQMPAPEDLKARLEKIGISTASRIVVSYSRDRIAMATRVLFTLDYAGLSSRMSLLDGGYDQWVREGRPTTAEVPAATPGTLPPLTVRPLIVEADFVKTQLDKPGVSVVDARTKAFYDGTQTGGSQQRPHRTGHIAGARNVTYSDIVDAEQKLKSPTALAALFSDAGVKQGDALVVYCHIGQQATAVIFAARTLGFAAVLYDGSFEDWSRRTDLPVIKK